MDASSGVQSAACRDGDAPISNLASCVASATSAPMPAAATTYATTEEISLEASSAATRCGGVGASSSSGDKAPAASRTSNTEIECSRTTETECRSTETECTTTPEVMDCSSAWLAKDEDIESFMKPLPEKKAKGAKRTRQKDPLLIQAFAQSKSDDGSSF